MSWLGLVLLVVGAWLAYRLIGALLKLLMLGVAVVGAYWFLAPHLGWPTVSELFYVLGPDFGGRRVEEILQPAGIVGEVGDRVVDGVVDRLLAPSPDQVHEPVPEPLSAPATGVEPLPEPADAGPGGAAGTDLDLPVR